jgi:hypothetical protein
MNPFQIIKPGKQKVIDGSAESVGPNSSKVSASKLNSRATKYKDFLRFLDDDESVPTSVVDESKVNVAPPSHHCTIVKLRDLPLKCLALHRQITIEANFDLRPLLNQSGLSSSSVAVVNSSSVTMQPYSTFVYPYLPRLNENYEISEYIAKNILQPRHWLAQGNFAMLRSVVASDSTDTSSAVINMSSTSAMHNNGSINSALANNAKLLANAEQEAALCTVQSRLLKWQDAFMHLFALFLHNNDCRLSKGTSNKVEDIPVGVFEGSEAFYVLGKSLMSPQNATNTNSSSV